MRYKYLTSTLVGAALIPALVSASGVQLPNDAVQLNPSRMVLPSRAAIYPSYVNFQSGKADLTRNEIARLSTLVTKVKLKLLEAVILVGYTDSQGNEADNLKLSVRRAQAVKLFFMSRGFPSDRIHIEGRVTAHPEATNSASKGRASNRRVEIEIQEWRDHDEDLRRMRQKNQAVQSKQTAEEKPMIQSN